jgi:hypothetical protein
LVLKESEVPYNKARTAESGEYEKLRVVVESLVNQYFAVFSAPSKKAELAEMQRLGVSNQSYNAFLKEKRAGKTPAQLCCGLNNPKWLRELAAQYGVEKKFSALLLAWESAKKVSESAYVKIVRKPII